jgi:hypothetical protein
MTQPTGLATLSRSDLALVARELMLSGHLQDRSSIPAVLARHPMAEANEIAIEEWMTTSPVYTRRMKRLMGIEGTGVEAILKAIQLEIGMPHQFLDAGYALHDDHHGEFWLRRCGALDDVTPMGVDMVRGMCHDIEDPTFDATAVATNRRARVRPLHRPPEIPKGGPACHWVVTIEPDAEEIQDHPHLATVASCRLASWPNDPDPSTEPGGWEDYRGPFDPAFELEDLSQRALVLVATEFAIQAHLLARAMMSAVARRDGEDAAIDVGRKLFEGLGWVAAERLVPVLELDDSAGAIATVLRTCHLTLLGDYLGLDVTQPTPDEVVVTLTADSPALGEGDPYSLAALLDLGADEILASIACGVNPRARVDRVDGRPGARAAWRIVIDSDGEPNPQPKSVEVVRFSTGPEAVFIRRRPLRR